MPNDNHEDITDQYIIPAGSGDEEDEWRELGGLMRFRPNQEDQYEQLMIKLQRQLEQQLKQNEEL